MSQIQGTYVKPDGSIRIHVCIKVIFELMVDIVPRVVVVVDMLLFFQTSNALDFVHTNKSGERV